MTRRGEERKEHKAAREKQMYPPFSHKHHANPLHTGLPGDFQRWAGRGGGGRGRTAPCTILRKDRTSDETTLKKDHPAWWRPSEPPHCYDHLFWLFFFHITGPLTKKTTLGGLRGVSQCQQTALSATVSKNTVFHFRNTWYDFKSIPSYRTNPVCLKI